LAGVEGAEEDGLILEMDFDPGTDGVTIGCFTIAGEVKGEESGVGIEVVFKKADTGCGAVGNPKIEVAIVVVVDEADGAGVVGEVPTDGGGDVSESTTVAAVEEGVVCFATTKRFVFVKEAVEGLPALLVRLK